jgi:hypothetical protein
MKKKMKPRRRKLRKVFEEIEKVRRRAKLPRGVTVKQLIEEGRT